MSGVLIDGVAIGAALRARVAEAVREIAGRGIVPGLAAVLVGDDPASRVYVRNKVARTLDAGMRSFEHRLAADASEDEILALVRRLNADEAVDGILVQLPLPRHVDAAKVLVGVDPAKDVDGFHPVNAGLLATGRPALVPCTPLGCVILAKSVRPSLAGLDAVVIGRSTIVGKPVTQLLVAEDCTVTLAHSKTRDLPDLCRRADLLVAAIGRPGAVRGDWIRPGAIVVDVGINRVPDPAAGEGRTKLVGDVAFEEARAVAGAITPVPGGVGPMTIACLLRNTVQAACLRRGEPLPAALA